MTIRVLLCDDFSSILPADIPSYPFMFRRLFDAAGTEVHKYEIFPVHRGVLPSIGNGGPENKDVREDGAIYLITGSRAGAYDDLPWIPPLEDWIRRAHGEGLPLAGICFGHQIIGQALGGIVRKADQGWGLGVQTVELKGAEGRAFFPEGRFSLIHIHQDQVTEPPSGAVVFAGSHFCPCAGMRIGRRTLTFQGHPEFTPAYARYLLEVHGGDVPRPLRRAALDSLNLPTAHIETAGCILSL